MSNLPLVNVTAQINDQLGHPCAGAVIKMRLCSPDKYQGLVVPREVAGVTDATGRCVLRVFPNALGYEGSVYDVHISFPGSGAGACGRNTVPTPMRPIRQRVYVPNEDCNLMDIIDLSPREPLPAGSLIPDEVAGYAAQAADSASTARSHAEAAASTLAQTGTHVAQAEAAKDAAQVAESSAATQAKRAKQLVDGVDETICNFETSVIQRAENAADTATDKAEAIIARMVDGMLSSWTLVQGVNEGGLLPLPEDCGYYPGHHAVRLSWDGLACHQNRQWEEVGEKGVLSHSVRLLFSVPAESDFEVNIAAHVDVPAAGTGATILEERLARVESNISGLSNVAVSYTELSQA